MDTASAPTVHLSPSPIGSRWYEKLGQLFGVDLRSLAALRISVGTIVIADLMNRATELTAHYTDIGVLPRSALLGQFSDGTVISLHLITGQTWGQAILFALAGALALAMVVGYRARLATGLSWAMMVSLHARNQMVLDSGDALLRMLLLWLTFLPTGAVWSLDAMARPRTLATRPFVSVATLGLMLQVCLVYVISALLKDAPTWANGNALFEALQLDQFATPLGHWLLAHPGLLRVLTHWVRYLELFGPLLAFVPIFTWRIRVAIVALFWSLHAGMGLTLELGHFPYICAAAWLA